MTESEVPADQSADSAAPQPHRHRIKIGSQREGVPVGMRPEPAVFPPAPPADAPEDVSVAHGAPAVASPVGSPDEGPTKTAAATALPSNAARPAAEALTGRSAEEEPSEAPRGRKGRKLERLAAEVARPERRVEVPNLRSTAPDLEEELAEALGDASLDDLIGGESAAKAEAELAPESRHRARVVALHRDNVFVDLGGRNQGVLSGSAFPEPPQPGQMFEVIVRRFDPEEGLFQVSLPGGAVDVADWSQIEVGMVVEARVTAANKGGLECEVNRLRAFMPASQISPYRVEDLEQFVGQRFTCVVTEARPEKRNLVVSHRAILEREQAEAKQQLLAELAPGQLREGLVRNIRDFGAFVDLGGVDGLIHVSQLSWDRVKHPSEVLEVGQKVKVKVQKIDPDTGKIGLSLRDTLENPWSQAARKFPQGSRARGRVSKIMDFGVFVVLEPGIEGLVHISELSHKRVWRASDVVAPDQEVDVKILSVDAEAQRISLSMKALESRAEPVQKEEPEPADEPDTSPTPRKTPANLKGGRDRASGGDQFGLNW